MSPVCPRSVQRLDRGALVAMMMPNFLPYPAAGGLHALIGAMDVRILDPRDMAGFVDKLANYPFSSITGVNTQLNAPARRLDRPAAALRRDRNRNLRR
jgi:hypothetical protein